MKRLCFALLSLAGAGIATAELDLLFSQRYAPRVLVTSTLERAIARKDGGYYGIGYAGVDLLVARFDANGNLIGSRRWDSPYSMEEAIKSVHVDEQNRLYVEVANNGLDNPNAVYMLQFSPELALNWAQEEPGGTRLNVLPSGIHMRTRRTGDVYQTRFFNAAGTLTKLTNFGDATYWVRDIAAIPATDGNAGFVFAGMRGANGWVRRVNANGVQVYETVSDIAASIEEIEADKNALVSGLGQISNSWYVWKIAPNGVQTRAAFPAIGDGFRPRRLRVFDGTRAAVLHDTNGYRRVTSFNRVSLATGDSSGFLNLRDLAENRLTSSIICPGGRTEPGTPPGFLSLVGTTDTPKETESLMLAAETLETGAAALVGHKSFPGTEGGQISSAVVKANLAFDEFIYDIQGYNDRRLLKSVVSGLGDVGLLTEVGGYPGNGILTVYNASGVLKFSRALILNGQNLQSPQVFGLRDGAFMVTGVHDVDDIKTLVLMRISATGTVVHAGRYSMKYASKVYGLTQPSMGNDVILGINAGYTTTTPSVIARIRPNGSIAYSTSYGQGGTQIIGMNGKVFWTNVISNLGHKTTIRRVSEATGLLEQSTSIDGYPVDFADLPGAGFAIATQSANIARVRRFEEANLAISHQVSFTNQIISVMRVGASRLGFALNGYDGNRRLWGLNANNLSVAFPARLVPPTLFEVTDLAITDDNLTYLTAIEDANGIPDDRNDRIYFAKLNANGTFAQEKRLERSMSGQVHDTGGFIYLTGQQWVRDTGSGPFLSKYTR